MHSSRLADWSTAFAILHHYFYLYVAWQGMVSSRAEHVLVASVALHLSVGFVCVCMLFNSLKTILHDELLQWPADCANSRVRTIPRKPPNIP